MDTTVGSSIVMVEEEEDRGEGRTMTKGRLRTSNPSDPASTVDGGHSIMDSSIGSSSVRSRFGIAREQLYEEFSDLMKEMGSYRNIELGKDKAASMNPLGAASKGKSRMAEQKVDLEDMLEHIQRRKLELGISAAQSSAPEDDDGGEDGRGGGKNVFSLTNAPYEEEDEKKVAEVDIVLVNEHSRVEDDAKSRGEDSLQLPTDSDANAMQLLEMQLGLVNSRSNSTTTLLKKPPRKVGPRPWYTSGGKSKLMVSSSSLTNLGGASRSSKDPLPVIPYTQGHTAAAGTMGGRRGPSQVRPFLRDGHDSESSVDGRQRVRAHSAGTNRWETRFGVISGAGSAAGSKGALDVSLWGSGVSEGPGAQADGR